MFPQTMMLIQHTINSKGFVALGSDIGLSADI
jgi:hypothetical protein